MEHNCVFMINSHISTYKEVIENLTVTIYDDITHLNIANFPIDT